VGLLAALSFPSAALGQQQISYSLGSIWWVQGMTRYDTASWAHTGSEGSCFLTYPQQDEQGAWGTVVVLLEGGNLFVHENGQPKTYYNAHPGESIRIKHRTFGEPLDVTSNGYVPNRDLNEMLVALYASSKISGEGVIVRNVPFLQNPNPTGPSVVTLAEAESVAESLDFRIEVNNTTYQPNWVVKSQTPGGGIAWPLENSDTIQVTLEANGESPDDPRERANEPIVVQPSSSPQKVPVEIGPYAGHVSPIIPSCNPDPRDDAPERVLVWQHTKRCRLILQAEGIPAGSLPPPDPVLAAAPKDKPHQELDCIDTKNERLQFTAEANTEYHIVVEGQGGRRGKFKVTLNWLELPTPSPSPSPTPAPARQGD
jgi:hypothetical protein